MSDGCTRCEYREIVGEDGLCDDCRELLHLRSRITELEAKNAELREALEEIAEDCYLMMYHSDANHQAKLWAQGLQKKAQSALKGGKDE